MAEPPVDEATLYLDGHSALNGEPIFRGDFTDACKIVWAMTPNARSYARIESDGWSYPGAALESMRAEDMGEI